MAYVYRHIRLDKNIPFYIGISSDEDGEYKRAYSSGRRNRNIYWNRISSIAGYSVDILLDGLSWEDACKKEIEFIALYGRRRDGGILANLTLGGEGQPGMFRELNGMFGKKASQETRQKQSLIKKGRPANNKGKLMLPHVKEAIIKATKGKPSWNKGISPSKETIEKQMLTKAVRGKIFSGSDHGMFGRTHSDELKAKWRISRKGTIPWNNGKRIVPHHLVALQVGRRISVSQYDCDGILVGSFLSINEASERTNIGKGNISLCCKLKRKSAGGYIWKFGEGI